MYRILKDGNEIAIVSGLNWVKKQENGCFAICEKDVAHGVALSGVVYHVSGKPDIEGLETVVITEIDDGIYANNLSALLNNPLDLKNAEQFRKALQLFAASLSEDKAIEVATVFDSWESGKTYTASEFMTYGVNSVGDPQLYKVVQDHTSAEEWTPDATPSLYTAIGLDDSGYPVWSQPSGAHDAYNTGDIVNYNGVLYESLIDGNVYSPEAYPDGWKTVE